jgi:hypothetical protein
MKIIKMLGLSVVVAFGVFLFIYGGYDDSPGAQGLGVVIVALGVWGEYRLTRSRRELKSDRKIWHFCLVFT